MKWTIWYFTAHNIALYKNWVGNIFPCVFPCRGVLQSFKAFKEIVELIEEADVVLEGCGWCFGICNVLDALPQLSGVAGVLEEALDLLIVDVLCCPDGMVQFGPCLSVTASPDLKKTFCSFSLTCTLLIIQGFWLAHVSIVLLFVTSSSLKPTNL